MLKFYINIPVTPSQYYRTREASLVFVLTASETFAILRQMKRMLNKTFLMVAVAATCLLIAFGMGLAVGNYLGQNTPLAKNENGTSTLDLAPFWKTEEILKEKFISTTASSSIPTDQAKVWGAIEGFVASYGDPYTVFFPPKETKIFAEEVRGDFVGVGMELAIKEEVLTVVAPLKGTPAARAGIKSGDQILKIEQKLTNGMSVEDAVSLIRGPKGEVVNLTVKQNGDIKELAIVRDTITIPNIDTKLRDDGVFVISLYTFSANSPDLFRNALREFVLSGSDKLVLDLRGNPGGYLDAAVDMASWFLPLGKPVVIEDAGLNAPQKITRSTGYNVFTDELKMVVLINGGSASASEILAGALSEHDVAKLVGEKSFGKGSVQELVEITPETSLKVTVARWLTPKGHSISENGLEPEVKVTLTKEDVQKGKDPQMEKAAELLRDPNFKP
ncbi:MAG: Carboxyl-terminal protease [Parcubacteria group bacterium GW2011_GWA1_47_8]|nr:MAG: Carboxyl-terminal protease [Parcubacteria group bacterium GW2011_GWA1_47_8]